MLLGPTVAHWLSLHGLVTLVAVLIYVVASHVRPQRRHPAAAIAWMLFILLVPYLALPAFLAFGSRKLPRPRAAAATVPAVAGDHDRWAIETIVSLGQPGPAAYRDLQIHRDGAAAHAALLATIDAATRSLDLSTFLLGRDAFGEALLDRLCERARSGLRVRLLVDGLGHWMAGRPKLARLAAAGGELTLFVTPWRSPLKGRSNLRNHRKLLVADAGLDAARLWCGGRNFAAEYFEGRDGAPAWHDLSFDLRGPLVQQAAALFDSDWAFSNRLPPPAAAATAGLPAAPARDGAQLVASGPDQVDDTLYALLVTAAYRARSRLLLATPYFVPEPALLMALCLAARRGVVVDLLLPARSNHRLSDWARSRALRTLAQAGGRVWLAPGMLHAKLAVVDDTLALAGSANLDSRSLFLNYELMIAFGDRADVQRFADWFAVERAPARPYAAQAPGLVRDVAEGMLLWAAFQL